MTVMNLEMEHAGNMVFSFTGAWLSLSEKPRHSVVSFPAAPAQAQLIPGNRSMSCGFIPVLLEKNNYSEGFFSNQVSGKPEFICR